jgi:hypothetical protein
MASAFYAAEQLQVRFSKVIARYPDLAAIDGNLNAIDIAPYSFTVVCRDDQKLMLGRASALINVVTVYAMEMSVVLIV